MNQSEASMEVICNGTSYILPSINQKENKITNIRRWEQGLRVYAAIYSEINPHRAEEIWQYVHIINSAAQSFVWENVAYYDYTFRQLMERKPVRSWAKIYTQIWNLAMRDPINLTLLLIIIIIITIKLKVAIKDMETGAINAVGDTTKVDVGGGTVVGTTGVQL